TRFSRDWSSDVCSSDLLPDGTRITPDQFIPVAEASGSIHKLTQWAINTALREGVEVNFPDRDYSVAVNVSASSIYDPGLVTIVRSEERRVGRVQILMGA